MVDLIFGMKITRTSGKILHHLPNWNPNAKSPYAQLSINGRRYCRPLADSGDLLRWFRIAGLRPYPTLFFVLTRACCWKNNIEVDCLPGATDCPALVNSGYPTDKFVFEGFLPVKKEDKNQFTFLAEET